MIIVINVSDKDIMCVVVIFRFGENKFKMGEFSDGKCV